MQLFAVKLFGQISPGELSNAHANMEGMSNCTKCHDLGHKVTNAKCLDCHKEIQSLIKQKRGYHANAKVKAQDCFECHSEHHGKKFNAIRLDEKKFDHKLTSYSLEGKHAVISCKDCHVSKNIQDKEIKKRPKTFLGLSHACTSCHDDYHQKTLSSDCAKCHDTKAFRPASKFDHNKTDYKLKGKHTEVDCKQCHKVNMKNGKEFQEFSGILHNDCKACHADPHKEHFNSSCSSCHTEDAFSFFIGNKNFNHNTTNFTLKGKHQIIDCFKCHKNTSDPVQVFEDRAAIEETNCASCHKDVHEGKFGNDCAQCHNEKGFSALKSMQSFDHNTTDYPLQGKHTGVDCKKCHIGKYTDPINFSQCKNCHEDYHKGEFDQSGSPDCSQCHSLDKGFDYSLFTLEQHQKSKFPLEGSHMATPCNSCHISENKWKFRNIGLFCVDCHKDVHENRFAINGVTDCNRCHDSENWFPRKFDHNLTKFPLDGKHAAVECAACHKTVTKGEKTYVEYKIGKFQCIDCHQ